jgi:hypothetical protein
MDAIVPARRSNDPGKELVAVMGKTAGAEIMKWLHSTSGKTSHANQQFGHADSTSIFTRKNWDDLNVDKSANCISGGHKKCKGKMRNLGEGPKRIPCGCECHQK